MRTLLLIVVGTVITAAAVYFAGLWWATFLVAMAAGYLAGGALRGLLVGAVIGAVAWALGLAVIAAMDPLFKTAAVISGVMGFAALGATPALLLTELTGLLLGLAGGWLGGAIAAIVRLRVGASSDGGPPVRP